MNDDTVAGAGGAADDDLRAAAAADQGGPAPLEQERDREEEAFERRASSREADNRIRRLLRDRHILGAELAARDTRITALEAQLAKEREQGLGAALSQAEAEVAAAHEAGDPAAIARANRRVAEIAANRTAAAIEARNAATAHEEAKRQPAPPPREEPQFSPTTAAWLAANPWYGGDARMTRQAQLLDQEASEEGLERDSPAYWRYIEGELERRFPGRVKALHSEPRGGARQAAEQGADEGDGGGAPARRADPAVAARVPSSAASGAVMASRGGAPGAAPGAGQNGAASSIRLSPEAREAARILGMTDQQYAARVTALAKQGRVDLRNYTGG